MRLPQTCSPHRRRQHRTSSCAPAAPVSSRHDGLTTAPAGCALGIVDRRERGAALAHGSGQRRKRATQSGKRCVDIQAAAGRCRRSRNSEEDGLTRLQQRERALQAGREHCVCATLAAAEQYGQQQRVAFARRHDVHDEARAAVCSTRGGRRARLRSASPRAARPIHGLTRSYGVRQKLRRSNPPLFPCVLHLRNATCAPCAHQQARNQAPCADSPVQSGTVLRCPALLLTNMSHAAVQLNIDELISTHVRLHALPFRASVHLHCWDLCFLSCRLASAQLGRSPGCLALTRHPGCAAC